MRRLLIYAFIAIALGWAGVVVYQSHRSGLPPWQVAKWTIVPPAPMAAPDRAATTRPSSTAPIHFEPTPIGDAITGHPLITHIEAADLDADGLLDLVVCDAVRDCVTWVRQHPRGTFTEKVLAADIKAPAHVQAIDFRGSGRLDLLVASMGAVPPNNDPIGAVVILENLGEGRFEKHSVISGIARVTDVRGADFDGDGRMDLAVAQFGYTSGETRWMRNLGDWNFESTILQSLSGAIHCPIADMDGDGSLDIVSLVSQQWEEIHVFANDGKGRFTPHLAFGAANSDYGSSSVSIVDLNADGRPDILYTNGDSMDFIPPRPRPWHGVQWLENLGGMKFTCHRIADFPGAYNASPIRCHKEGPIDLVAVSLFNQWDSPTAQSMVILRNDGRRHFTLQGLAQSPTHLLALAVGDFRGDGTPSIVTGGLHMFPPFDRMSRLTLWTLTNRAPSEPASATTRGAEP